MFSDPYCQLGTKGRFRKGFVDDAGDLSLPCEKPLQFRVIGGLGSLVGFGGNGYTRSLLGIADQLQKFLRLSLPLFAHTV